MTGPDAPGSRRGSARFGVRSATQLYSGVTALQGVDYEMQQGTVHGLVGENGSGKSTLIKILTGAIRPTGGTLYVDGNDVSFALPAEAQQHGVAVVHQDYNLFPDLSVAANVFGITQHPPRRRWSRMVDKAAVESTVEDLFSTFGIVISPRAMVRTLGPAERKFVEIARAMLLRPKFLILDEPTASLEPQASRRVLDLLERLRSQDVGLCFVSHRLDEVLRIADRISVLRDGRLVEAIDNSDQVTEETIAELIIGQKQVEQIDRPTSATDEVMVRLSGLRLRPDLRPVEFEVRRGEIFGLTGLLGSGATEVVQTLGGLIPLNGQLEVAGKPARIRSPRDACRLGIGFIPEDRKAVGLVPDQSVAVNVSLASLPEIAQLGFVNRAEMTNRAVGYKRSLDIRAPSVGVSVKTLSGGNQQKVMLARCLASGARLLAIEEPTHGVDIGAKAQVHDLLRDFAGDGGTIVVASTDVHEVLALCDRIAVMRHGTLLDVLEKRELSHRDLAVMGARDPGEILETLIESGEQSGEAGESPA